jgi:hypothetical protein
MDVMTDHDGCFLCPDCLLTLDFEESNGRDTETMGGYSVEYLSCPNCTAQWEIISNYSGTEREIYPSEEQQ